MFLPESVKDGQESRECHLRHSWQPLPFKYSNDGRHFPAREISFAAPSFSVVATVKGTLRKAKAGKGENVIFPGGSMAPSNAKLLFLRVGRGGGRRIPVDNRPELIIKRDSSTGSTVPQNYQYIPLDSKFVKKLDAFIFDFATE